MNGTGFPLTYLFLENNERCEEEIRTAIIQKFLTKLRDIGVQPEFLLSDKDFVQINAARFTWKEIKIQLCKWHIKRAVLARLSNNKMPRNATFNPLSELGSHFPLMKLYHLINFVLKNIIK